ncbi:MAG: SEC-C metal-binding domain-containing protein [Syntrophobacteraceae bacterium]|jgi:HEAT repeat protein
MQRLWNYEDFVGRLAHPNSLVRTWAFDIIEKRFPRHYTPDVAKLIGDPDEHLACAAPRYLARHKATEFAADILDSMFKSRGNVPSNCALALGDMHYEPAVDPFLEMLPHCEDLNTFLGILHYLGKIHSEDCHHALQEVFRQIQGRDWAETVAFHLLEHHHTEDVPLVLEAFLSNVTKSPGHDRFLKNLACSVSAGQLFDDFAQPYGVDILGDPQKTILAVLKRHSIIEPEPNLTNDLTQLINRREYAHIATSLMFNAQKLVRSRFPDQPSKDCLPQIYAFDKLALTFLEEFSRRVSSFNKAAEDKKIIRNLVSAILANYFSIAGREAYTRAFAPEASCDDLLNSLKFTGAEFPETLQDRLVELSPVTELKAALSEDLLTWGDIWTVRLMGRIGDSTFVPDLVQVLSRSDSLSYIHGDAIRALNGIDESGHEEILNAIQSEYVNNEISVLALLEHLPYAEAFDFAVQLWRENKVESFEMYGNCLEGIGDARGIKVLREVYRTVGQVDDSLETLSFIHSEEIPELPELRRRRVEDQERQLRSRKELDEMAAKPALKEVHYQFKGRTPAKVLPMTVEKVGRNQPCPCGSGKKYKKCCLMKK